MYRNLRKAAQAGLDTAKTNFDRRELDAESSQARPAEAVRFPCSTGRAEI